MLKDLAAGPAVEPIAALLKDEAPEVRVAAVDAVRSLVSGRRTASSVVEALRGALADDEVDVGRHAAEAWRIMNH